MSHLDITTVIVTYGNRALLVKQVIEAALSQGVGKVVLVDNASVHESAQLLDTFVKNHKEIHLICHQENEGSAGGFYAGLEYVLNHVDTDYIWLLDDDNVPQENALNNLLKARDLVVTEESKEVILYSYRGDAWLDDWRAVSEGKIKGYKIDSFMGFDLINSLKNKLPNKKPFVEDVNYPIVKTYLGPYGGMFLSLDSLKKVDLPNKDFYLYADDHEYSLRFNRNGIKQFLIYSSKLKDIDFSFSGGNRFFSHNYSEFKLFYSVRNHVYLSQSFKVSKFKYTSNKLFFFLFQFLKSIPFLMRQPKYYFSRIKLILKAVADGEKAILGKTF